MSQERLMVVEDDEAFRYALRRFLAGRYDVAFATNGEEALALWKERSFDLVLLDMKMSGMESLDVLKWTKKHHPECPVVAMTGYGSVEMMADTLRAEADSFLYKPIDMPLLEATLKKFLAEKGRPLVNVISGTRVMVVDDEEELVSLFRLVLEAKGAEVLSAADGIEALERIQKERPDVILLDIMLPGINGMEVCRKIKSEKELSQTLVVLYSAILSERHKVGAMESGADAYFSKFNVPYAIIERIEGLLRARPRPRG